MTARVMGTIIDISVSLFVGFVRDIPHTMVVVRILDGKLFSVVGGKVLYFMLK